MKPNRKKAPDKPEPPALPSQPLTPLPITRFDDEQIYENISLTNPDFDKTAAKFVILRLSEAKNTDFAASVLQKLHISDTTITSCDLSNADFEECSAHRVALKNCRLIGFRALDATWEDLTVKNCQMTYASFGETTFKRVIFDGCDLTDADFIHTNLEGAVFRDCKLSRTRFSDSHCKGMDLRGSDLEGIIIGPRELQGVIIEPSQAAILISNLGVKVKWPDEE